MLIFVKAQRAALVDRRRSVGQHMATTEWDSTEPDGTPQKLLDGTRLADAGWTSQISLRDGLASTVTWYHHHVHDLRAR